jgi:hypothetical protein
MLAPALRHLKKSGHCLVRQRHSVDIGKDAGIPKGPLVTNDHAVESRRPVVCGSRTNRARRQSDTLTRASELRHDGIDLKASLCAVVPARAVFS